MPTRQGDDGGHREVREQIAEDNGGGGVPATGDPMPTTDPLNTGGTKKPGKRHPRAVQVMPEGEREVMLSIMQFLRTRRDGAKMTNEQIAAKARERMPLLAVGTVTHLMLPKYMSNQSDVGYRLLRSVLYALGSSHAELEAYLRTSAQREQATREREQERVLLQNFRRLFPMHRTWLIRHAQEYAGLDGLAMIGEIMADEDAAQSGDYPPRPDTEVE